MIGDVLGYTTLDELCEKLHEANTLKVCYSLLFFNWKCETIDGEIKIMFRFVASQQC